MTLEVRDAAFSYDGRKAVFEGLNLTVEPGEVFCLLGPNGCGKTTLLRCIAGMERLRRGEVLIDGRSLERMRRKEVATLIGYIPQEHGSAFPYTVLQIVLMGRAPYLNVFSSPSAQDVLLAEAALERVGMSHLRDRRYTGISGGEKQMVLIARVLAQQPRVLLLDEPTSHLDFRNQTLVLSMIRKLATAQRLTIIMTSHSPNDVFALADRVALMGYGGFIAAGRPGEVLTDENLSRTYRMPVKVYGMLHHRFCVPALDDPGLFPPGNTGADVNQSGKDAPRIKRKEEG
ncbi:MAG: ABC transporter ATP-binding protein [Clostridia bacterium]|nr:ABC transporter ATP-binding protein [Clostridia bacterium]MDH7572970.1 ABC transporter ATP-binding protein [Clostridia bacterium]